MDFDASYAQLPSVFYERALPQKMPKPQLLHLNQALCEQLGLSSDWLESPAGLAMLSGNELPDSARPIAMAYAGHQFGGWSPRLGDGRAILLGDVLSPEGVRYDVQLKGSGRTPFSRGGDGKASLGSVVREYIVGEAMFALGVPSTRALAVVKTGESIARETPLPGAILTRVAQSHIRVGTFQYFQARQDTESIGALADYLIARNYPEAEVTGNRYAALFDAICMRQADLIAKWMLLGFIHGVMNTDNMQLAGETIDFGPCAFMDDYHPKCVFSSIDRNGRYAWDNQPSMGQWNLARLGEALLPIFSDSQEEAASLAEGSLDRFNERFNESFFCGMRAKLGIGSGQGLEGESEETLESDREFIKKSFGAMAEQEVDFTLLFRRLTQYANGEGTAQAIASLFADGAAGSKYVADWDAYMSSRAEGREQRGKVMKTVNPIYIPRNHRVEEAIVAARQGDMQPFKTLTALLATPYKEQEKFAEYEKAPTAAQKVHETFCGT